MAPITPTVTAITRAATLSGTQPDLATARKPHRAARSLPGVRAAAGVRRLERGLREQPASAKRQIDPLVPISPYGASKAAGEIYLQAFSATYGFETDGLRYCNVFGPRQDPGSPNRP